MKLSTYTLKTRFDELEADGLSETLRHECQNAIEYRKWGDLGNWTYFRRVILGRIKKYQPRFLGVITIIFEG